MLTLVKKSAYISLGLAAMSLTMLEELGERIAKEAKLSEKEGKKLVDDLIEQSKKSKAELTKTIEETVQKSLANMDIATADDLKKLDKRLSKIEKSLPKKKTTKSKAKA